MCSPYAWPRGLRSRRAGMRAVCVRLFPVGSARTLPQARLSANLHIPPPMPNEDFFYKRALKKRHPRSRGAAAGGVWLRRAEQRAGRPFAPSAP